MLSRLILCSLLAVLASACATTTTKRAQRRAAEKQTRKEIKDHPLPPERAKAARERCPG